MLLNDKLSSENWISAIVKEIVSVPMKVIIALSWYDVIEVLETAIYLTKCRKVYRNPKIKDNFKIVWLRLHVFLSVLEMGAAFFFFIVFIFFLFLFFSFVNTAIISNQCKHTIHKLDSERSQKGL